MLGSRTKQVSSYGRRGSRIVNASDRRGRESPGSSKGASDADIRSPPRPLRAENAIILPHPKPRIRVHRQHASNRSPGCPPLAQNRSVQRKATRDTATKRIQSKVASGVRVRQPLTPLRSNGTSSNGPLSSTGKNKSKTSTAKPMRTGLKPHTPVIAVDIIVLDNEGNMLTQERRLSYTEAQTNHARLAVGKGKKSQRASPPPITISDDSDLEVASPKPVTKRWPRRPRAIVISSDESEADDAGTTHKKLFVPLAKSHARSEMLRAEVVIPPAPFRKPKVAENPLDPVLMALTPPRRAELPAAHRPDPAAVRSHLALPFPIQKPRQLTPIRGSLDRSVFRRPPPTPSTPTEADLSLDLAQLNLSVAAEIDDVASAQPEYLVPLLEECAQTSPYEFSAFIETFPFDPIVQSSVEDEDAKFRKIGEASYSEVFGIGDVVLKIVPVRVEEESVYPETVEIPASSDAKDVLKEIIVTREVGGVCGKFVKLLKTYVVRGRYPSLLLDLWDEYNDRKGSESIRPDSFRLTQVYAIIILPNGGPDLESYVFKNASKSGWHQACGIFWQVARALEQAEHLANFEVRKRNDSKIQIQLGLTDFQKHRDLHWGQILVKSIPVRKSTNECSTSRVAMDDARFGVSVTIIDLGLSRMDAVDGHGCKTYWTPFDSEIFEGEGDYQYDIYRMMRGLTGGAWKPHHPFTNVMWLHYLVTKLLHEKRLKPPGGKRQTGAEIRAMSPTGYDEQECYDCLAGMERLLGTCIASARKGQKSRRKAVAPTNGPMSARDIIAYGMRQGWVR